MSVVTISKQDIAVAQLRHAVELFKEGEHLISVITLAGAAEDILGKLAEGKGYVHALDRSIEGIAEIIKNVWGRDLDNKARRDLRNEFKNRTRNELKHLCNGDDLSVDLQREAVRILDRAVKNYELLFVRVVPFIQEYKRWRYEGEGGDL
jgi:hypothetical protein